MFWRRAVPAIFIFIFAIAARAQPHIAPFQPSGWSAPVVVTTNPNSPPNTPILYNTNDIYVNWSVINNGTANASTTFYVDVYSNSVFVNRWTIPNLPRNNYEFIDDQNSYNLGQFPAGANTVSIV